MESFNPSITDDNGLSAPLANNGPLLPLANDNGSSASLSDDNGSVHVVPPAFLFGSVFLGLVVVLASLTTLTVLNKCSKLVYQVRFASINLTLANLLYGLTIITSALYSASNKGKLCVALLKFLPFCFTAYYLFLTAIGLDRLLSLKLALKYTFWTNRRNAYIAALGIYIISLLITIPNLIEDGGKIQCQGHPSEMFNDKGILTFSFSLLILLLIQITTYGYIGFTAVNRYKISRERLIEGLPNVRKVFKGFWKVTLKSFHLCVLSAVLIGPFILSRIVEAVTRNLDGESVHPVTYISLVSTFLHQIASPIFILITYKECRYTFLRIINFFDREKKRKLESEYKQYYATYGISVVSDIV